MPPTKVPSSMKDIPVGATSSNEWRRGEPVCVNCLAYKWKCDLAHLKRCSRCKVVTYCSEICQLEHYNKNHKKFCKLLVGTKVKPKSMHSPEACKKCQIAKALRMEDKIGRDQEFWNEDASSINFPCMFVDPKHKFVKYRTNNDTGEVQITVQDGTAFLPIELGEISGNFSCPTEECLSILFHICLKLWYIRPKSRDSMKTIMTGLWSIRQQLWDRLPGVPSMAMNAMNFACYVVYEDFWFDINEKIKNALLQFQAGARTNEENAWWVALWTFQIVIVKTALMLQEPAHFTADLKVLLKSMFDSTACGLPSVKELETFNPKLETFMFVASMNLPPAKEYALRCDNTNCSILCRYLYFYFYSYSYSYSYSYLY